MTVNFSFSKWSKNLLKLSRKTEFTDSRFSKANLAIFAMVFGGLGVYGIISSFAASAGTITINLPATSTSFDNAFGAEDSQMYTVGSPAPGGGYPNIAQRLSNLNLSGWRMLSQGIYLPTLITQVSDQDYYWLTGGTVRHFPAWNFTSIDKNLSEVPAGVPRLVEQDPPPPDYYCANGSWTDPAAGCNTNNEPPGGLLDQSYGQAASFYADLVKYYRTSMLASGSGTTSYTSNTLTDTAYNFNGDTGDCITATVVDSNGFSDWVQGTVASVGGANNNTVTLSGPWSAANSFDQTAGTGGQITSTTPAAGAAYNLASCTPPAGLTAPDSATPWPRPPSVGDVQYFEIGNEDDLSQQHTFENPPSFSAPTPNLAGVNVSGGVSLHLGPPTLTRLPRQVRKAISPRQALK